MRLLSDWPQKKFKQMAKTINFAQQVKHKPDQEKLVRLVVRTTTILAVSYLMLLVSVFGVSFYFQAKLKSLEAQADDLGSQVAVYDQVESRLTAVKKRIKLIGQIKEKEGEGLVAGLERALSLINNRSVVTDLKVGEDGARAEVKLAEAELKDLLAVFEDSASLSEDEGGYPNVQSLSLRKESDGTWEYGFIFELEP